MKKISTISLMCIVLVNQAFMDTQKNIQASKNNEYELSLTIRCSENDLKQGDEIPIVFTIVNKGQSPYVHDDRNYDRSGRMNEYKLVVRYEDGTVVRDPRERHKPGIMGGLSGGRVVIEQGESFSKTIALNRWALINEPGRYTVTGTYFFAVPDPNAKQVKNVKVMKEIPVNSEPIEILVKPRTHEEMGNYINELLNKLEELLPYDKEVEEQREAIIKKLMYTCDCRIAPTIIDLMYKSYHTNEVFWAKEAFLYYLPRSSEIKNLLLETAKTHGLALYMQPVLEEYRCSDSEFKNIISLSLVLENPNIVRAGVLATHDHPDDAYTSRLISIATDPNKQARHSAIFALAYNRTDEGVKALKTFLKDHNEGIRETTAEAIRQAYKHFPVYPEYSDGEYTSELIEVATDVNPNQPFAIAEIARTRTPKGVKAIKSLLEDPAKNIPIAETDEGVKTIRALLRSPDKDIREMTGNIIRLVYKTYPGQPLRNDDFGEEFRENFGNRKTKILERLRDK